LKLVAGLMEPSRGTVRVTGRTAALVELGTGLDPDATGWANIELMTALSGLDRREVRARTPAIAEFSGLGPNLARPVREYSSGMFLRLAFAIATAVDAEVLVIDEVLSVGDLTFRGRCLDRLERFRREGGTLLAVSHDLDLLAAWCPRSLWLDRGRVTLIGPTAEVVREYVLRTARATAPPGLAPRLPDGFHLLATLLDEHGDPIESCRSDRTARIRFVLSMPVAMSDPVLSIRVSREDWAGCFVVETRRDRERWRRFEPGTTTIDLILEPVQLLSGRYVVSCSLAGADGPVVTAPAVMSFAVERSGGAVGIFASRHRWTIESRE
jgi:ABC-type polysaccharide/polyol phosphate transport system ATPase subunit